MTNTGDYWVCRDCKARTPIGQMHVCPGPPKPKGKPGRPKGSKNKPKTES